LKDIVLQAYVRKSDKAVEMYQRAFGSELENIHKNDDGTFIHVELNIKGYTLAVSETFFKETITGNTMQFIFRFGENGEAAVKKAYEVLKDEARILYEMGPCDWSPLMFGLIDKFGINWCIAI